MPDKPNVLQQVHNQRQSINDRLAQVKHVVAVMSGKGGVGKSALTANLAAAFGLRGLAVGVLDADIHGPSAAAMLGAGGQQVRFDPEGARPAVGTADVRVMSMDLFLGGEDSPVAWKHAGGLAADSFVWRGTLEANVLREFLADTNWGALDYLLVDMPPGADRFETLMRLVPGLSGALVVGIPSRVSHQVVRRAVRSARAAGASLLGYVENMAGLDDSAGGITRGLFADGSTGDFCRDLGIPFWGKIPFDPLLSHTTDSGRPFIINHAHTPAGESLLAISQKLEEVLG